MKIGITSQNFKTITGHAGKTRRFLIYESKSGGEPVELERWDFPKEMSMHEYRGSEPHPLQQLDIMITGGCGEGFKNKLARMGVLVLATGETDQLAAAQAVSRGETLPPAVESDHDHGHSNGVTLS